MLDDPNQATDEKSEEQSDDTTTDNNSEDKADDKAEDEQSKNVVSKDAVSLAGFKAFIEDGALFKTFKLNASRRAVDAYNRLIAENIITARLLSDLSVEDLEAARVAKLLEDAETIHATDAAERKAAKYKALEEADEAEYQYNVRQAERKRKLAVEAAKNDPEQATSFNFDDLSQEEQEIIIELEHGTKEEQTAFLIEKYIASKIKDWGGEDNLTDQQREQIEKLRRRAKKIIDDSRS